MAATAANLCPPVFTRLRGVGSADPFAIASAPIRLRAGGLVADALLGAAAAARLFGRPRASLVVTRSIGNRRHTTWFHPSHKVR